jgi:multiple sugar transport system substrate-binding protein
VLEPRALFYDKSLFARARLDPDRPPQTWDELRRAAAAIQRLGRGVHGFGLVAADRRELFEDFMPFAWGNGGEVLSARLDSSRFDSPQNRAALAFYLGLRQAGTLARRETLEQAFEQGRLGLMISGAGLIDRLESAAPELRFGVALVPAPGLDRGVHASLAEGEVLVSFTASRRKEAALRLARFLARPANALEVARSASRFLPATAGVETLSSPNPGPERTTLMRQLANARFKPDHPEWDAMEAAIEDAIGKALEDRGSPAESAAARATAEADRAIAALVRKR